MHSAITPNSTRISIIIPIYNGARFLTHAVYSALKQTVPAFEIILVDDASTDESKSLVDMLVARYPQVRGAYHNINQGVASTWNTGFEIARGDLLLRLAQDDTLEPTALETLIQCADKNLEVDVYYADCLCVDANGNMQKLTTTDSVDLFIHSNRIGLCVAIRRRVWEGGFRYDPKIKAAEDLDFFTRVFAKHRFMKCISPPLLRVLWHAESGSSKFAARQQLEAARITRRLVKNSPAQRAIMLGYYVDAIYLSRLENTFMRTIKILMEALGEFPLAWLIWKQLFAVIVCDPIRRRA